MISEFEIENGILKNYTGNVSTIMIPDEVTRIARYAFAYSQFLAYVKGGKNLEVIEEYAFYKCGELCEVDLQGTVNTIGDHAFEYCTMLSKLKLREGLKRIGNYAFTHTAFPFVDLPHSTEEIGKRAFAECNSLNSIILPDRLKLLEEYAFSRCSQLSAVTIGKDLKVINDGAFYDCFELTRIELGNVETISKHAFGNNRKLTDICFPSTLKYIGEFAFSDCRELKNLTFQEGLKTICKSAFSFCETIQKMRLPDSLEDYAPSGKMDGKTLSISISSKIKRITDFTLSSIQLDIRGSLWDFLKAEGAYNLLTKLDSLSINGEPLDRLTIPDDVEEIPDDCFACSPWLTALDIGKGVKRIGKRAFSECINLKEINWSENAMVELDEKAFNNSLTGGVLKLQDYKTTSEAIDAILNWLNGYRTSLDPTQRIAEYASHNKIMAFNYLLENDCDNNLKVYLDFIKPDVIPISELDYAIEANKNKTRILVQLLDYKATAYTQQTIDDFYDSQLTLPILGSDPTNETDGFTYKKIDGGYELTEYTGSESYLQIPDYFAGEPVLVLGKNLFYNNNILTTVRLGKNVKIIRQGAFLQCRNLNKLILNDGLEEIYKHPFLRTQIERLEVPKSVIKISERAFVGITMIVDHNSFAESFAKKFGVKYEYKKTN